MAVTVSRGELLPFLEHKAGDTPRSLEHDPDGLCLLIGETAIRNLRSTLVSRGLEPAAVAELETIQSVARNLSGRGSPRVIPESVKRRLLVDIVEAVHNGDTPTALQRFVARVGTGWDDERYETLLGELETYWRMTDAGTDRDVLEDVIGTMTDPYAEHRTRQSLTAFDALDTMLHDQTDDLPPDLYLSESHLVRETRDFLPGRWSAVYGDLDWIAMASVKAIDNGVLRFLREIAEATDPPDIHCFFNEGTADRMAARFEQAGIELGEPPDAAHVADEILVEDLVTAASRGHAPETLTDDVSFVETPDRRREIEQVARRIEALCTDTDTDRTPGDFLVVVREAIPYQSTIADIFSSHGLPFHVEAQQPVAQVIAYRMVKATIDLIAADAAEDVVEYHEIAAPIRLGYCMLGDTAGSWPLDDASFLDVEERLHELQMAGDGPKTVAAWRTAIDTLADERGDPWPRIQKFLSWVVDRADTPPDDGAVIETLLRGLVEEHIANTANTSIRPSSGPGVDTTRTDVGWKHHSHLAREAVLGGLVKVRQYYNYMLDLSLAEPGWQLAAQALGQTLGQDQYSVPNRDGNAVRVVIPANAYFLETDHTYVVGLGADEFPTGAPRPTFLHERFYEAVWEYSATRDDSRAALLYSPSREQTFQRELDDYEATLRTTNGRLTLSYHQRDLSGDEAVWSPFVDAVAASRSEDDSEYTRIRQSQWLPGPGWYGDWETTTDRAPMRDRLRLAVHHLREGVTGDTFVPRLTAEAIEDGDTLRRLLRSVDGSDYDAIKPGHRRFSTPQTSVTVDPDEVGFSAPHDLHSLVGEPIRAHELDLYSHCELKYYFYQYFFSRDGPTPARDSWPATESPTASELYPTLPTVLANHYAPVSYRVAMAAIVRDHLPNRQADIAAFEDIGELRAAFEEWRDADARLDESVFQTLVAEYLTVTQEQAAGITREWNWVDETNRDYEIGDHTVRIPPHRVDTIGGERGAKLPVFGSARPGTARVAMKNCWQSPSSTNLRGEKCSTVCRSCGKLERCDITTKGVLDSRVRAITVADETLGGLILDRFQSAPRGRQGFYRDDGRFEPVAHEQHLDGLDGGSWKIRKRRWESDLEAFLEEITPANGETLSYEVDPDFVENGGCEGCVYRDLCMVPYHFDEEAGES